MERPDGRAADEPRPVTIEPGYLRHAEGSALISVGDTRVICAASVENRVPAFLRNTGSGWVTAEYSMLPRSTNTRVERRQDGRAQEIQRLIGRALRAAVDLDRLSEHTIVLDCDVLQADGGTRTASITGAWVALAIASDWMQRKRLLPSSPLRTQLAATSVGVLEGAPLLDFELPGRFLRRSGFQRRDARHGPARGDPGQRGGRAVRPSADERAHRPRGVRHSPALRRAKGGAGGMEGAGRRLGGPLPESWRRIAASETTSSPSRGWASGYGPSSTVRCARGPCASGSGSGPGPAPCAARGSSAAPAPRSRRSGCGCGSTAPCLPLGGHPTPGVAASPNMT